MNRIIVDKESNISTIKEALKYLDPNQDNEIFLKKGYYFEKIKIKNHQNNLKIVGEDKENTVISFNDYARKIHEDGLEFNTFRTYTLMILGSNVELNNLTIENTCGCGKKFGQGVALSVTGDNIKINNCILKAHQDTIFLGPLPKDLLIRYKDFLPKDELIYPVPHKVFINDTYIEGDVDFIFGGAEAYFDNCKIHSLKRNGFVFAPSTEIDEEKGFVVRNCVFTGDSKEPNTYLARPWRDYGMVELYDCVMDNHIHDLGFDKWNDTNRDKTCRFNEHNSRYFDNHDYVRCHFVNKK